MRRLLRFAAQFLVSAAILWALFRRVDPQKMMAVASGGTVWLLLLAAGMVPAALFFRALRWYYLLHDVGATNVGLGRAWGLYLIGVALNLVVPGGLGELAKAYYGHRATGVREEMLSATLVDKLLGLFSLCLLGAIAAGTYGRMALCAWGCLLTVAFAAPVFFPRLIPWGLANWMLRRFLHKQLDVAKLLRTSKCTPVGYARALAISLAGWAVTIFISFLVLRAFAPALALPEVAAVAPFVSLARLVPVALGGVGTSDSAVLFLLGPPRHAREVILPGSLTLNVLLVLLPAVVGLVCLWSVPSHRRMRADEASLDSLRVQTEDTR